MPSSPPPQNLTFKPLSIRMPRKSNKIQSRSTTPMKKHSNKSVDVHHKTPVCKRSLVQRFREQVGNLVCGRHIDRSNNSAYCLPGRQAPVKDFPPRGFIPLKPKTPCLPMGFPPQHPKGTSSPCNALWSPVTGTDVAVGSSMYPKP